MKKTISAQGLKLALIGATLAVSGAAFAADSNASERFHDRGQHSFHHGQHGQFKAHGYHHGGKGMHRHHHAQRAGLVVPGYGVVSRDFIDGMGLNDEQLKLIEEAREAAREQREARKSRIKEAREARADRFKADTLNPEQALKQADETRAQWQAERRQIDEKWIAVWNSLDADQQARVSAHLKDKAERARKRAEQREERREQREKARAERSGQAS